MAHSPIHSILRNPARAFLCLALPFSYYPRLIDGDTQPWPLLAAIFLLLSSKSARILTKTDILLIAFAFLAIVGTLVRFEMSEHTLRFAFKVISFLAFWMCARSLPPEVVAYGMKMVISLWFIVGVLQTIFILLGFDFPFSGRFIASRGGVPSLTPEPSMYGMLSIVALIYLRFLEVRTKAIYTFMAISNVFLSGSILGFSILVFLLFLISNRAKLIIFCVLSFIAISETASLDFFFLNRLTSIWEAQSDWSVLALDYSINLRVGHIVFTTISTLLPSLVFFGDNSFGNAYNAWASKTGVFLPTGSDFILTGLGDIVFHGGIFGAILLLFFFYTAFRREFRRPWLKVSIVLFLMLAQLGFTSLLLILFALLKKDK